jgi:aspartate dehydrogenase
MGSMKCGLVGCGNIATDLCKALEKGTISAHIVALSDVDATQAKALNDAFSINASLCTVQENAASVDFLIECAVAEVVPDVVSAAIAHQVDCLIMSVGGLLKNPALLEQAQENGVQIYMPSGALCGLDGIRSAMEAGLDRVTLTTRKPPAGLSGAPYLVEQGIDVDGISVPLTVFEGNALEAVKAFPKNVNVAAALSFAGLGPVNTQVRVIADPEATLNSHEIYAEGAFGQLSAKTENKPSPRNAKSSYLASLSAIAEIRKAANAFQANRPA